MFYLCRMCTVGLFDVSGDAEAGRRSERAVRGAVRPARCAVAVEITDI